MKNQMNAFKRMGVRALGMVALCASISACTDDYTLDDEKPSFLGESVYWVLQNDGNFEYYRRLMDDLGMKEVLERTGSRTVFAAPDSAFEAFFAANAQLSELDPWHNATSYENLTTMQKNLLAKSTMLNNSITMETLSTQEGTLERGKYLRRPTLVRVSDNFTFLRSDELPVSYNLTGDVDYWAPFRSSSYADGVDDGTGTGVYLTDGDGTTNMMLCFTPEQRAKNNVTGEDFSLVMNLEQKGQVLAPNDVYIYDARITRQDITCENGYINMLDRVVRPLPNMAEVLRTNGQTRIFSHILDRFSAPVYIQDYNEEYALVNDSLGSNIRVYSKWYFSSEGSTGMIGKAVRTVVEQGVTNFEITTGPGIDDNIKVPVTYALKFDPSWNACQLQRGVTSQEDMAAIFAPDDATLLQAFQTGVLSTLLEEFTTKNPAGLNTSVGAQLFAEARNATLDNLEPLYRAIDQIPLDKIQPFVNNLMRDSYNGSVQSKFPSLKNDAQESLFGSGCTVRKVELACNGAIYITSSLHAPADYSSVAAPVKLTADKRVMEFAIYDGSKPEDAKTNYMRGLYYFAYLKAMTSRFTFFLPDDAAMRYVYNPMSFATPPAGRRMVTLAYNKTFDKPSGAVGDPIRDTTYTFNIYTGVLANNGRPQSNAHMTMNDKAAVLTDILQTHTLVHETEADVISQVRRNNPNVRDNYYVTRANTAMRLTYADDGSLAYVQGGFQIENEQAGIDNPNLRGLQRCNVTKSIEYQDGGNGDTYIVDAPVIPAVKDVFTVLEDHPEFHRFLSLCMGPDYGGVNDELIQACGFYNNANGSPMKPEEAQRLRESTYTVFLEKNSTLRAVTAFFNQYQYTVFVPTEAAIEQAHANNLFYDWQDIYDDFYSPQTTTLDPEALPDIDGEYSPLDYHFISPEDSIRVRAKITHLFNFVRLHFMDNSVFADQSSWARNDDFAHQNYATSCFYQDPDFPGQGNFMKLHVRRLGYGQMTVQGLGLSSSGDLYPVGEPANVLNVMGQPNVVQRDNTEITIPEMPLCNIMAREIIAVDVNNRETDIHLNGVTGSVVAALNGKRIGSSSSAVVHLIDQVLLYSDQRLNFDEPSKARAYLRSNRVVNRTEQN